MKYSYLFILALLGLVLAGCSSPDDPLAFTPYKIADGETITAIQFADDNTGCATTVSGNIYRTTDGGRTFSQAGSSAGRALTGVYFADDEIGLAFGKAGALLRTSDGGVSWVQQSVDTVIDFTGAGFFNDDRGLLVGNISVGEEAGKGVIGRSTDQGVTWNMNRTQFADLGEVDIVPETHAWILSSGSLIYSTDAGETWERVVSQVTTINSVFFTDVQHGWEVGDNGLIRYSTDGGWSWQAKLKMTDGSLNSIIAPEPDRIYISGDRFLAVSTDHGHRWVMDTVSHAANLVDMHFVGKRVFAVGSRGELITLKF